MSNTISLTAAKRDEKGSAAARRLRKQGIIPAVIYSDGNVEHNLDIKLTLDQFQKVEHHAGMIAIDIDGIGAKNAIVKDIQYKAISSTPLAVDFLEVIAGHKVTVVVPVEAKGEPEGIRQGGQLEQVIHELELEIAPADIPEAIIVDVDALKVDDVLTTDDIKLPESAKIVGEEHQIVFQVRIPHTKEEEPAAAAPAEGDAAAAAPAAPAADAKAAAPAKK